MTNLLRFLFITNLLFSLYTEISCIRDCNNVVVNKQVDENKYTIATFLLPSQPNKIDIRVELSIDPNDFDDKSPPATIRLFDNEIKTIERMVRGSVIKYEMKYPEKVDTIEAISLNGQQYCENNSLKNRFSTRTIFIEYNLTLAQNPERLRISKDTYYLTNVNNKPNLWLNKFNYECGRIKKVEIHTINNGKNIRPNEHPWLVALFDESRKYFCGGTLISDQHVISAAHCTIHKTKVYMELGKHQLDNVNERGVFVTPSEEIIIHPNFINNTGHADISLIISIYRIPFSNKIRPICIWPFESHDVSEIGTIAPWGYTNNGSFSNVPIASEVGIVSSEKCLNSNALYQPIISNSTFCAGGKNEEICLGAGGSGLLIYKDDRWYLKGVLSMRIRQGLYGCDFSKYDVYSDVGKHLDWLKQYLIPN